MVLDAVSLIRKRIKEDLGFRVPESVPADRPSEFVLVVRNGGGRLDVLRDSPRIDVHCWADTEKRAREMSDAVSELMFSLNKDSKHGFLTCTETTRRRDPDPDSSQPRWYGSYLLETYKY